MRLIIISGWTSTGKSTLAGRLGNDLNLAVYHKDSYKDTVYYPSLARKTSFKQWLQSEKLSWQEMYHAIQSAQGKDTDLIIEGDFTGRQQRGLRGLLRPRTDVVEVYCYARGLTTYRRFVDRSKDGRLRHPGHRDERWYWVAWLGALSTYFGWYWVKPLRLGEALLKVDTTDFKAVDYAAIRDFVSKALHQEG